MPVDDHFVKQLRRFVIPTFPHALRWRTLSLVVGEQDQAFVQCLEKAYNSLLLSNLETPNIRVTIHDEDIVFEKLLDLIGTWDMPKLRRIRAKNVPLWHISSSRSFASIESLEVSWLLSTTCRITEMLRAMPNLIELYLSGVNSDWDVPLSRISLCKVKKFALTSTTPEAYGLMLGVVHMPALESSTISIYSPDLSIDDWVSSLPPHPSVKELKLYFFDGIARDALELSLLLGKFEGLQRLFLYCPHHTFFYSGSVRRMPPLRTCTMTMGHCQSGESVKRLVQALRNSGKWDDFEYFEFAKKTIHGAEIWTVSSPRRS